MEAFESANFCATPLRTRLFLLVCFTALLLPGAALAAVSVSYGDFGPGNSFHPFPDAWCVSGATATNCTTMHVRLIAAPVVPQANLTLSQVKIALNWVIGTNSGTLKLVNDAAGFPGTTVLESWSLSNLPSTTAPAAVTLNSTGGVTLLAHARYWLVASAPNTNTMLVWFTNSLGLDGGVTSLDNGPWTALSPFPPAFGGDSLPAYAVIGTQATGNPAGAGCSGSNPQTCVPFPPAPSQASTLYGAGNPATSAPPSSSCGDPVTCSIGNMTETMLDLFVSGRGRALTWTRTYNSQAAASATGPGPLGFGWTDSYAESLAADGSGNEVVTLYNGSTVTFSPSAGGGYTAPPYVNATLVNNPNGTFTLTFKNARADTFSASGQLIQQTDRHGYLTTLSYDALGNLTTITDPARRSFTVTTSAGLVTSVRDPMGRTVRYAYDANNNLISCTDVAGNVTRYAYDSQHQITSITDPLEHNRTITYDSSNRVTQQTSAQGRTTSYAYSGAITTITLGDGHQIQESFNDTGQLLTFTRGYGTPGALTWTFTYDPSTLARTSITDPAGDTTTATYDSRGNLVTKIDPLNRTTQFTYNTFSDPLTIVDPSGVTTTLRYDAQGTLTSVSRLGATVAYAYTDSYPGDVTAVTDATGLRIWRYAYDSQGDLTQITDAAGNHWTLSFNPDGWLLTLRTPLNEQTTYTRDSYGAVTAVSDPLGAKTTYSFDAAHNLIAVTNADNHTIQLKYDLDNLQIKLIQPDGSILQTGYDGIGEIITQADGLGHVTTYGYDPLERLASITDPLGRITSLTYDSASRLHQRIDPAVTSTLTYDAASELTGMTYSDGTPGVTYSYDSLGRRVSMIDGTGTTTFQWDAFNRLAGNTDGSGRQVSYSHDLAGRLLSIGYPADGALPPGTVTRTYDNAGRLASIIDFSGQATKFAYDADDRLVQRSYPNGITTHFGFDADSRLTSIQDPLFAASYTRDPMGLVKNSQTTMGQDRYTYTALNQLASDNVQSFAYDTAPDITGIDGIQLKYDAADELTSALGKAASFTYDPRGNRVRGSFGPLSATYTYDGANRLTAFAGIATYTYTGDGLRASKTVSGHAQSFVWDRAEGLALPLEDGVNRYIFGPGGLPIEQVAANGTTTFLHQDQLGSTRALSNANGKLTAAAVLTGPFGQLTLPPGATPFGFAGQYTDTESGLVYMRARYYDPLTAQFLTRDPLVAFTQQPYLYAAGDPVNVTDPTGADDSGSDSSQAVQTVAQYVNGVLVIVQVQVTANNAINTVTNAANGAVTAVTNTATNVGNTVSTGVSNISNSIGTGLTNLGNSIQSGINSALNPGSVANTAGGYNQVYDQVLTALYQAQASGQNVSGLITQIQNLNSQGTQPTADKANQLNQFIQQNQSVLNSVGYHGPASCHP